MGGTAYPPKKSSPLVGLAAGAAVGGIFLLAVAILFRLGFASSAPAAGETTAPGPPPPFAAPPDLASPDGLYAEAEKYYPLGSTSTSDRTRAAGLYRAFADSFPRDPRARESLIRTHEVLDALGEIEGEIRALEDYRARYPTDGRMPYVLFGLGSLYREKGEEAKAKARFSELLRRYPMTNYADEVRAGEASRSGMATSESR